MGEPLRVLVVDDEPLARRGILRLLATRKDLELQAECRNGREAIERIGGDPPDLVLLDVEMPKISGIDVLEAIGPSEMPPVIFITAHDRYAVTAFEAHAVDYLLKPVDPARFHLALDRALETIASQEARALRTRLGELLRRFEQREGLARRLVIREAGRVHLVPVEEIDWIEAADNYVRVHRGNRYLLQRETLTSLESRLDPKEFVRIHRSTIVRLDRIRQIVPQARGDCSLLLESGQRLAVSRRFRPRLDELL